MNRFPATSRQRWYFDANKNGLSALNVPVVWQIERCDTASLQAAVNALTDRHEALRTTLVAGVEQEVAPDGGLPVREETATTHPGELRRRVLEVLDEPFQVRSGSLTRARLLRTGADRQVLVLSVHHAVCDGWSAGIIFRDLAELYLAAMHGRAARLPDLTLQFADYATWEWTAASEPPPGFWQRRLESGLPRVLLADTDGARSGPATFRSFRFPVIPPQTARRLHAVAASCRTTPARVIGAAVVASLIPYIGTRATVGVYVGNRDQPDLLDVVGDLADRLPVEINASANPTFTQLIRQMHSEFSSVHDHFVPLSALAPLIRGSEERAVGPLLDVTLNYLPHRTTRGAAARDEADREAAIDEVDPALEDRSFRVDHWQEGFGLLDYQHRPQPDGSIGGYLLCNVTAVPPPLAAEIAAAASTMIELLASDPDGLVADTARKARDRSDDRFR
jgi:hypothetical protein